MARGKALIRQWNLLKILQTHHFGISRQELAKRLDCSDRQVLRDIQILQDAGFPIDYETREYGKRFWKLSSQFIEREELILTMTEILSLFVGQQLLSPLSGTQIGKGLSSALEKIKALLPESALSYFNDLNNTLLVKRHVYNEAPLQNKIITIINDAIMLERVLHIKYKSAESKKIRHYNFYPYGLIFMGTSLYCIGYVEEYNEMRTLKVERIIELAPTDREFKKPLSFSLNRAVAMSFGVMTRGKPKEIKIKFTGWAATNIREYKWHSSQEILKDTDDCVIAKFILTNTVEFKRWVLGFGKYAIVLSPKSFQNEILEEIREMSNAYESFAK